MDDLVQFFQFFRACLDEDERIASATVPGPWEWTPEGDQWGDCGPSLVQCLGGEEVDVLSAWGHDAWGMSVADGAAEHIARHDPARVLAEVDVKRQVLDRYEEQACLLANHMGGILTKYLVEELLRTVRLLALPYADRPGYLDKWRPAA
ncbi:DUF6221 family protein [Streptomyces goshikiensis]|uniref:DUF6221 family protein n=1 Tax=Streptomyces goshikiensis TaxID=1942 RepID=UPI0036A2E656